MVVVVVLCCRCCCCCRRRFYSMFCTAACCRLCSNVHILLYDSYRIVLYRIASFNQADARAMFSLLVQRLLSVVPPRRATHHRVGSWLLLFTNLTPRDRADVIFCWVSNENGSPVIVQNLNETVFIPQTEKKSQSTQKKSAHRPTNLLNKCNSAISLDSPIVTVYKCNGNRPRTDEQNIPKKFKPEVFRYSYILMGNIFA